MARLARTYFQLLNRSLFQRGTIPADQRRGLGFCLGFFATFPQIYAGTRLCMALDRLMSPGLSRTPIQPPVFIIGCPRSGTTILHRVMSLDDQYFYFRSWEMVFPSLLQKRLLDGLAWCDARLGRPFERTVLSYEKRKFEKFNRLHQVGLFLPEEDEKLLLHILATGDAGFLFPYAGFTKYTHFDDDVERAEQDEILDFYDACVRRQAYLRGNGGAKRLLSKNPWFTGKIDTLRRRYPDARVIYLVRNPLEVVPSMISLARHLVVGSFGVEPGPDLDEMAFQALKRYYFEAPRKLAQWPLNRCLTVNYHELIREPEETIRQIYEQLQLPLSPQFEQQLRQETGKMKQHRSQHRYSLDDCAIPKSRIIEELKPIFEQYDFEVPSSTEPGAVAAWPQEIAVPAASGEPVS